LLSEILNFKSEILNPKQTQKMNLSMRFRILIALLGILAAVPVAAQRDPLEMQIIRGLAAYRSELMERHPEDLLHVKKIVDSMYSENLSAEFASNLLYGVYYISEVKKIKDPNELIEYLKKYGREEFAELEGIDLEEVGAMMRNAELLQLIDYGVLKEDYPWRLADPDWLVADLGFYDIRNGHKVGEIGAGEGLTSMMFAVIFDSLDLYVNEISEQKLTYVETCFQECRSIQPHNTFHTVLGSAVSTGLEGGELDRIIILHSYHHFSKFNKMLASIRQSLAPDGQVIVVEPDAALRKQDPRMCRLAMKKEAILKIWEKNGFQLLNERKDGTAVYLKFAVRR